MEINNLLKIYIYIIKSINLKLITKIRSNICFYI